MTCRLTNDQLVERLRQVLDKYGKLNNKIIQESRHCPGYATYHHRFGGLLKVYERLGYNTPELRALATARQRAIITRYDLLKSFEHCFPGQINIVQPSRRRRALLKYRRTGLLISLVIARKFTAQSGKRRWMIEAPQTERKRMTILALMDEQNAMVQSMRVFRKMNYPKKSIEVDSDNRWLQTGMALGRVSDLLQVIRRIRS